MTASLPDEVQQVFDSFITTEFTTVDRRGQPICWPVTPYYRPGDTCIDVTTALGYPKKALDARANPKVALLFSDPTGSGLEAPPQVLVQGIADVDHRDLDANRERYGASRSRSCPARRGSYPPRPCSGVGFYFTRIYVHVRPERVYVWPDGDATREPRLFDAHMEEVRSGHDEEPDAPHAAAEGGAPVWDSRMAELGERYPEGGALARRAGRLPVQPEGADLGGRVRAARAHRGERGGLPVQPGLACLTAHDHHPDFTGSGTSRCAATSWRRTAAGRSPAQAWSAASSCRRCRSCSSSADRRQDVRFWRKAKKTRRELGA